MMIAHLYACSHSPALPSGYFFLTPYCLVLLLYHSASGILSVRAICHFFPFFLRAFFFNVFFFFGLDFRLYVYFFFLCCLSFPACSPSSCFVFHLLLLHHSYICCGSIHSHCVRKTNDFEGTQWDEPFFNYTIYLYCVIEKCISY